MKRSLASLLILFSCASSAEIVSPWSFDEQSCVASQRITFPDKSVANVKYTSNSKNYLMAVHIDEWELVEFTEPVSIALIFDSTVFVKGFAHFLDDKSAIFEFPVTNSHDHLINSATVEIIKAGDGGSIIELGLFGSETWIPKIVNCIIEKNADTSKTSITI